MKELQWPCTECGGDATIAYVPDTIRRGSGRVSKNQVGMAWFYPAKGYVQVVLENGAEGLFGK